jgi:hypothetical protein
MTFSFLFFNFIEFMASSFFHIKLHYKMIYMKTKKKIKIDHLQSPFYFIIFYLFSSNKRFIRRKKKHIIIISPS